MKYTLYIREECGSSQRVRSYVQSQRLPIRVAPVEEFKAEGIVAVPALFGGGKLRAVGPDIVDYLRRIFSRK